MGANGKGSRKITDLNEFPVTFLRFVDWRDARKHARELGRPISAVVGDEEAMVLPDGTVEACNAAAVIAFGR